MTIKNRTVWHYRAGRFTWCKRQIDAKHRPPLVCARFTKNVDCLDCLAAIAATLLLRSNL